jgi:hypothetical protein
VRSKSGIGSSFRTAATREEGAQGEKGHAHGLARRSICARSRAYTLRAERSFGEGDALVFKAFEEIGIGAIGVGGAAWFAGAVLAGAIGAGRVIRFGGVLTHARRRIARACVVAFVLRGARDGVCPGADARLTRIRLRTRVTVIAR